MLMEVPFVGSADVLVALAEHAEGPGLQPVIAHPERAEAVQDRPALADELAERGWLAAGERDSLLGRHGPDAEELGWRAVEAGRRRSSPRTGTGRPGRRTSTRRTQTRSGRLGAERAALRCSTGRAGSGFSAANSISRRRRQAPERLHLDLPHALAREPEAAADLLERLRLRVVEPVAQHEHLALAAGRGPSAPRSAPAERRWTSTSSSGSGPVAGDEVAEHRVVLFADRLVEARRRARRRPHLERLLESGGSPPRRSPRASARGRAASRASARRGSSSAAARRCGRASGSCAPCRRARAPPPGGSTRWRRSRT